MAPPLFIVGNDRSGTTMLRLILDRGPDVAIPPESMFLTDFAPVAASGRPGRPPQAPRGSCAEVWHHPKVRLWELPGDPPAVPPGLGDPASAYRFAVEAPFRAYAARHGKPRWARQDAALRPPRRRTCSRSGPTRASSCSSATAATSRSRSSGCRSAPTTPGRRRPWWARGIRAGAEAQRAPPATRCCIVRYEDLVADPDGRGRGRSARSSAAPTTRRCSTSSGPTARGSCADQASWFPTIFEGISTDAVGRWRTRDARARPADVRGPRRRRARAPTATSRPRRRDPVSRAPGALVPAPQPAPAQRQLHAPAASFQERGRELRFALARRLARPAAPSARRAVGGEEARPVDGGRAGRSQVGGHVVDGLADAAGRGRRARSAACTRAASPRGRRPRRRGAAACSRAPAPTRRARAAPGATRPSARRRRRSRPGGSAATAARPMPSMLATSASLVAHVERTSGTWRSSPPSTPGRRSSSPSAPARRIDSS